MLKDYSFLAYFITAPVAVSSAVADDTACIKNNRTYFLPRGEINNYNVLIDGRKFYNQPTNDLIKQYDEVKKVS